uniref:Protein BIC1 n=1 Tax=Cannabis sativa TaxID=3483 RepID=A0A803R2N9_CANSA
MEEEIITTTYYFPKKMRFSHQKPSQSCPNPNPNPNPSNNTTSLLLFSCKPNRSCVSLPAAFDDDDDDQKSCSGRERLKRHRDEVAGRVRVPDKWGKEELMKDWIDYSSFDKLLAPIGLRSAREALVVHARRRRNGASTY